MMIQVAAVRPTPQWGGSRYHVLLLLVCLGLITAMLPPFNPATRIQDVAPPAGTLPATPAAPTYDLPSELVGKAELPTLRTANTETFDAGNGVKTVLQDVLPLHYRDDSGAWQRINPAFAAVPNGWSNATNTIKTYLAPNNAAANLEAGAAALGWQPVAITVAGDSSETYQLAAVQDGASVPPGRRSKDGTQIRYLNSWSDAAIADQWSARPGSSEYTLRIGHLPKAPAGWTPAGLDVHVKLHLQPGTTVKVDGQAATLPIETASGLEFANGDSVLQLAAPQTYELRDRTTSTAAVYRLNATGDPSMLDLVVRTPWHWLADPGRVFPVVVDPLFQMRSPTVARSAVYNNQSQAFIKNSSDPPLEMGQFKDDVRRIMVRFDLPTIPPGATVTGATVALEPREMDPPERYFAIAFVYGYMLLNNGDWATSDAAPQFNSTPTLDKKLLDFSHGQPTRLAAEWDATEVVKGWYGGSANYGLLFRTEQEFCPTQTYLCSGFYIDNPSTWSNDDLAIDEALYHGTGALRVRASLHGGVRLLVSYTPPVLNPNVPIDLSGPPPAVPTTGEPYYHATHNYQVPTLGNSWEALVVRGFGPTTGPQHPTNYNDPYVRPLAGTLGTRLLREDEGYVEWEKPPAIVGQVSSILLNGHAAAGNAYTLEVRGNAASAPPAGYDVRRITERDTINHGLGTSTTQYTFSSENPLDLLNLQMPRGSNSRVDVTINPPNTIPPPGTVNPVDYSKYLRYFRARLLDGTGTTGTYAGNASNLVSDAPSAGDISRPVTLMGSIFKPQSDNYALALAYDGPRIDFFTCIVRGGEFCDAFGVKRMQFDYSVRVTSCDAASGSFPTSSGGCQFIRCPTFGAGGTPYRQSSDNYLRFWSQSGWNDATSTSTDDLYAPLVGQPSDTMPSVAVLGGTISYDTSGNATLSPASSELLIDCNFTNSGGLSPQNYFSVFAGGMQKATIELQPNDSNVVLLPAATGHAMVKPWASNDVPDLSGVTEYIDVYASYAAGYANLRRGLPIPDSTATDDLVFGPFWRVDVGGWSSLVTAVDKGSVPSAPVIAGLTLDIGTQLSLDTKLACGQNCTRTIDAVRIGAGTITQPAALGGASKPIRALIFPRDAALGVDPDISCPGGSCIDLRATDDTPDHPNRTWAMPDVHTNTKASSVVMSTNGAMLAYSTDHPAARHGATSPMGLADGFSFDTSAGTVSVAYKPCGGDGPPVVVVEGDTKLAMPNLGAGDGAENSLAASFRLCQTHLRQVTITFKSSVGIPVASSGLFVTGLNGRIDINPDYTTITIGVDFQSGQGDNDTFRAHGNITIDTRGLFKFDGHAKIVGQVDADGKLWVAWNPLDIGFQVSIHYHSWLSGFARAHLWKGQGWQHKYSWLPDNDDRHIAAQISATLRIEKGQAFSWWFIKIPPSTLDFNVEVAFGQFCTNDACSTYEWGIKGKFRVVGYDVGLYYGFDHGFDFILGNDDHVLIDQYGGGPVGPIAPTGLDVANVRPRAAAAAVDGTSTESFTVKPGVENLLFALGWQAGAPQLALVDPNGLVIDGGNALAHATAISTTDNSILMGVQRPQPGLWQARISNLRADRTEHYKFVYFANHGNPGMPLGQGTFTAPIAANEDGTTGYTIRWSVPPNTPPAATISLRYARSHASDSSLPQDQGNLDQDVPIVQNLPFVRGRYVWNTQSLASGNYTIRGIVDDGVNDLSGGVSYPDNSCDPGRGELPTARAYNPARFPGTTIFTATGTIAINDTTPPAAPTNVALTGVDGAIMARWNPSPEKDLAAFLISWGTISTPSGGTPTLVSTQSERITAREHPAFRVPGLNNGVPYGVTVAAIDASGNVGPPSGIITATPDPAAAPIPPAPWNVQKTGGTSTSATLTWSPAPGSAPAGYHVVYTKLGRTAVTQLLDTTTPSTTLTGLVTGATYAVSVSATNAGGWHGDFGDALRFVVTDGVDADGDGLPDDWAAAHHVHGGSSPAPSGDGLTNLQKYQNHLDPNQQDSDGDGWSDFEEVAATTDPLDAGSYPSTYTQPRLYLEYDHLVFHAKLQDGGAAPSQDVRWSNNGGGKLNLTAASNSPWLKATIADGPDSTVIRVALDTTGLAPGFYHGTVKLAAAPGSDPIIGPARCIAVEAWVSPADTAVPPLPSPTASPTPAATTIPFRKFVYLPLLMR